ncbi:MAG: S8 family serine peptidase [Pirellulales bacterium]
MKRRNRANRRNHKQRSFGGGLKEMLAASAKRQPKTWTFERLEDRYLFSATPLDLQIQTLSSNTAEGLAAQQQREADWWNAIYSGAGGGSAASSSSSTSSETSQDIFLRALPTDPLFLPDPSDPTRASQWHLLNSGQLVGNPDSQPIYGVVGEDINVVPVWQGLGLQKPYTGQGVVVAVIDSGVQLNHPDLAANISTTLRFDAITGDNNPNPTLFNPNNAHGTAVAGLIAADNNGIGGVGVAYDATIAPIRLVDFGQTDQAIIDALRYRTDQIDITNNSWGPADIRTAVNINPGILEALRDSVEFGRDGLGVIHVWASGNGAGPGFLPPFESIGFLDVSNYDPYVNSRYTIAVTGVDHDGMYSNVDGTFTSYPEIGTAVLVAAPTGSNAALNIGDDTGLGSGIVTTDFTDDNGYNFLPLAGVELDRDFLLDPDYTSRFNGTSAAAPIVSGVVALMLEANPNLTWRDVQEILVRSARQNAQFEEPSSGGGAFQSNNTWQTNQLSFFQDPDPFTFAGESPDMGGFRRLEVYDPVADPALHHTQLWTNAAGYTVSMGYGVYSESTGYGHGVVDAALAVKMAENWHTLDQERAGELTFSTFVVNNIGNIRAAQKAGDDAGLLLVPGALSNASDGFIDFWDEYFVEDDPETEDDGPFSGDDPPDNSRGLPYLEFSVPDDNAMTIESVEVKLGISGALEDLDELKITLVSPDGTFSEFNPFGADGGFIPFSVQQFDNIRPNLTGVDLGNLDVDGGTFTWTFNTVRNWGERSSDALIMDPATLEPALYEEFSNDFGQSALIPTVGEGAAYGAKGWRIFFENWSDSGFHLDSLEMVFHGNPIQAGTQRVQGAVGLDQNDDGEFNFSRYNQAIFDLDNGDVLHNRLGEVQNFLDTTQEQFASNVLVSAYKVVNGVALDDPEAQFITGDDGNYYFDLVPGEYIVRATDLSDPLATPSAKFKTDENAGFMPHYLGEWHITQDWFLAPDRVYDPNMPDHHEIKVDQDGAPVAFTDMNDQTFDYGPRYLNFLVDPGDIPPNTVVVNGSVFADLNADGVFNGDDAPASGGFFVYHDVNRNGVRDAGEDLHEVSADGSYTISVPTTASSQLAIGIVPPNPNWVATNPAGGVQSFIAGPGDQLEDVDFLFAPPQTEIPGLNQPGDILGIIFSDRNGDGIRQTSELGVAGFKVYADANENGTWDDGEIYSITASNGAYFLANVPPGTVRVDVVVPSSWSLTLPAIGYREVILPSNGTITNVRFGVLNLASADWGDLPDSYKTSAANDGPRHTITPDFSLGTLLDGEVSGVPTSDASGDDAIGGDEDGIVLLGAVSNPVGALVPGTTNAVRATLNGVGGYLNAWFDFNRDGDFNDPGEHAIVDRDLNPGIRDVTFSVPSSMVGGPIAARFRWGHSGISYFGLDGIGEVEDYFLENSVQQSVVTSLPGDYNGDHTVNDADYAVWRNSFGSTSNLAADGSGNGQVDAADYGIWRDHFGQSIAGSGSGSSGGGAGNGAASQDLPAFPSYEVSPELAAHYLSLGYVPVQMHVGLQVVTVYMMPNAASGGSGSASSVASRSLTSNADTQVNAEDDTSHDEIATFSLATEEVAVSRTHDRHGYASHRAARVDSALLVLATMSGGVDRKSDGESCDLASAWHHDDENGNSAVDLALASFEAKPKWRRSL